METGKNPNPPDCLWMQADVVRQKKCSIDFNCPVCRYDKALRNTCAENKAQEQQGTPIPGKRGKLVFWKDKLRMQPLSRRPCIHHMKGHIGFKTCPKAYHCIDCEFDQYFHDQFKVYALVQPVAYSDFNGVNLPAGYYLHPGHTWLKIEDKNHVRIGLDDFAARILGDPDYIEPLLMGKQVNAGDPVFTFYRNENKAAFPSPVSGVVTQVNSTLRRHPEQVGQTPYTGGWVLTLYCPSLREDLKRLMFMESAATFMNDRVNHLYTFLEEETQLMAADGGTLGSDLYGNLPQLSWEKIFTRLIPEALPC
ncbi:MAG: glycine cleavage system protein H [Desulfobacterales bacterium]|nr:glycine cleavage system protein H [Desulfobacterales bacterium]